MFGQAFQVVVRRKEGGVQRVSARVVTLERRFVAVNLRILRTIGGAIATFRRNGRGLTRRIVSRSRIVGNGRARLRGGSTRMVTLRRPIAVSLHRVVSVLGTDTSLRHLTSRTIGVSRAILSLGLHIESRRVSRLLAGVNRGITGVLRSVLSTCARISSKRTIRVTRESTAGSRVCSGIGALSIGLLRADPRGANRNVSCLGVTGELRHVNSCVAGVTR